MLKTSEVLGTEGARALVLKSTFDWERSSCCSGSSKYLEKGIGNRDGEMLETKREIRRREMEEWGVNAQGDR